MGANYSRSDPTQIERDLSRCGIYLIPLRTASMMVNTGAKDVGDSRPPSSVAIGELGNMLARCGQ